jgi:hypothetical protein
MTRDFRRIVFRHTHGPYPGLRQIIGLFTKSDAELGRIPDVIPAHPAPPQPVWPDGRLAKALRLRSTETYVEYVEQVVDAVVEPAA